MQGLFGVTPDVESNRPNPLVLHVEDDEGDAHLVVRCLSQWPTAVRIQRASDGREALSIFESVIEGQQETPDLVLLDLKLPYYHGVEVLRWARAQASLSQIPIVMLTSSDMPSDVEACHEAGCTEYVVKPMDYLDLKSELEGIRQRHIVTAPLLAA